MLIDKIYIDSPYKHLSDIRRKRRKLYSKKLQILLWQTMLTLFIFIILMIIGYLSLCAKNSNLKYKLYTLKNKERRLKVENQQIKVKLDKLNSINYIAEIANKKLKMNFCKEYIILDLRK